MLSTWKRVAPAIQASDDEPVHEPSPLRLAAFRRLAAAFTINELGNCVGDVALAILVFDRTGSALATAALFLALRFLPALLGPMLTSRVETFPPQRILPAIHLAEGAVFVALAWLASRAHFSLPAVLALGAADGMLSIAAAALTRGATATLLLSDGTLRRGNAILNMGFSAGGAAGPALAGVLVSVLGVSSALLVDAGTFAVVAMILAVTSGLRLERAAASDWRERLRAGLREAWSRPGVRRLLIAEAVALVFFTAVVPIEVVYAKRTLGAGDAGYGALLACWGAGMVIGSITYAAAPRVRLLVVLAISTALIGIGYAGISVATSLSVACAFSVVGGAGNGAEWIAFTTAIQQSISMSAQSSVMALVGSINQLMPGLGFMLGGALTTIGSPRTTYGAAAVGVLLVLLVTALRPPAGLDQRAEDLDVERAPT